jgi:hypothetical protein
MGHNFAMVQQLTLKLSDLPKGASVLELGAQEINPGVEPDDILNCARAIHRDEMTARSAALRYDPSKPLPMAELFRDGMLRYRCLDLMPGPATIVADLNVFRVSWRRRGGFDLITNFGTSEHVADQINTFRVMHDFAAVGATFLHKVPFAGYFNHGLYNYHPTFFVFLAAANEYKIEHLNLSPPHQPYTIPAIKGLDGCDQWSIQQNCGILTCHLRKMKPTAFRLFTDFDANALGQHQVPEPFGPMITERYDLRVR